jgi:hypothetical protein
MYMDLKKQFGYCVIPKNTLLYRAPLKTETEDCQFFALTFGVASYFGNIIHVWKVTNEIEVLFLIDSIYPRIISAIPELYKIINPSEINVNDLDVKCTDRIIGFAKELSLNGVPGFFSNVEENDPEICLFGANNILSHLQQIDIGNRGDKKYFKSSLRKLKIFPSDRFYQKTKEVFADQLIDSSESRKEHAEAVESWIEEAETDEEAMRVIEFYYDLRLKLKI